MCNGAVNEDECGQRNEGSLYVLRVQYTTEPTSAARSVTSFVKGEEKGGIALCAFSV